MSQKLLVRALKVNQGYGRLPCRRIRSVATACGYDLAERAAIRKLGPVVAEEKDEGPRDGRRIKLLPEASAAMRG